MYTYWSSHTVFVNIKTKSIILRYYKKVNVFAQLFEGMKAYRGIDGQIRIFRPELNMMRMNRSAERAGLPQFDSEQMIRCICRLISIDQEWVPHSESASLYIRPTLIGTEVTSSYLLNHKKKKYIKTFMYKLHKKSCFKQVQPYTTPQWILKKKCCRTSLF